MFVALCVVLIDALPPSKPSDHLSISLRSPLIRMHRAASIIEILLRAYLVQRGETLVVKFNLRC